MDLLFKASTFELLLEPEHAWLVNMHMAVCLLFYAIYTAITFWHARR